MFSDALEGVNQRDDDGAKRVFFGGERFLEGIAGEAYITVQRTDLNSPLGLEVQLHITEAVCPALSEPGLRALLRFFTGLYVCLNRGDVDPKAQQRSAEAAGRSLVSIVVDHIFLCIKDAEFQLELLMQSLCFSRLEEEEEIKRLRKELVPKAQPMPYFDRPFIPRRFEKLPTIPREPKFHIPQHKKMKCCFSWNDIGSYTFLHQSNELDT